jgi:hypothetical protein
MKSVYIPGSEGMDDGHDFCGLGEMKARVPSFRPISPDFFDALVDYCEPNDGTALYRTAPATYSVMVLALAAPMSFSARRLTGNRVRPMTGAERQQLESEQRRRRNAAECTTVPASLDEAVVLLEGELSNPAVTLRLSSYIDPGCAGHLTRVYVLDLLQGGALVRKLETFHYKGAL